MRTIPFLIAIALCVGSGVALGDEPKYEFEAGRGGKGGETVEVRVEEKQTVFAITSNGAVGAVTIRLKAGQWPQDIVLRLNKSDNVESFGVTTDRITFGDQRGLSSGGVKASSRKMGFRFPNEKGVFEDGPSAGTLDVVVESGKEGLDFTLPANVFVGTREVQIHWLVFVR